MTAQLLGKAGFPKTKPTDNHHIAAIHSKPHDLSLVKKDGGLVSLNEGENVKSKQLGFRSKY